MKNQETDLIIQKFFGIYEILTSVIGKLFYIVYSNKTLKLNSSLSPDKIEHTKYLGNLRLFKKAANKMEKTPGSPVAK